MILNYFSDIEMGACFIVGDGRNLDEWKKKYLDPMPQQFGIGERVSMLVASLMLPQNMRLNE